MTFWFVQIRGVSEQRAKRVLKVRWASSRADDKEVGQKSHV